MMRSVERSKGIGERSWLVHWRNRVCFIRLQRSIQAVDLERVYENTIESHGDRVEDMAAKTIKYFGKLIKDSVYVDFLKKLGDKVNVTDAEIKATSYYQESWECLKNYGSYQGATDEVGVVAFCRQFLELYSRLKKIIHAPGYLKPFRAIRDHFTFGFPQVFKIADSDYWMVGNGHHRLACLYALGQKFARAIIEAKEIKFDPAFNPNRNVYGIQPAVKISVVIPTYNRAEVITDTLDCLLKQKTNNEFNYEIIVVDNNSKDRTKEVVESYIRQFPERLRYLFESKQARAHALNAGIRVAKGEIICCTDDDCLMAEDYLWNINKAFSDNGPDAGIIGGKILPKWLGGETPGWLKELFSQPARYNNGAFNGIKIAFEGVVGILDLGDEPVSIQEARKVESFIQLFGANMALRRKIFEQYGGFTAVNRIGEDTDMCNRLLSAGVKCVYTPNVRIFHKVPVKNGTPQFYYHWWFSQGINKDLRQRYDRRFYFPFGIPMELIRRTLEFLHKFIQEKDPLLRVQWRMYVHYQLGQMANMLNRNFMKRVI